MEPISKAGPGPPKKLIGKVPRNRHIRAIYAGAKLFRLKSGGVAAETRNCL